MYRLCLKLNCFFLPSRLKTLVLCCALAFFPLGAYAEFLAIKLFGTKYHNDVPCGDEYPGHMTTTVYLNVLPDRNGGYDARVTARFSNGNKWTNGKFNADVELIAGEAYPRDNCEGQPMLVCFDNLGVAGERYVPDDPGRVIWADTLSESMPFAGIGRTEVREKVVTFKLTHKDWMDWNGVLKVRLYLSGPGGVRQGDRWKNRC